MVDNVFVQVCQLSSSFRDAVAEGSTVDQMLTQHLFFIGFFVVARGKSSCAGTSLHEGKPVPGYQIPGRFDEILATVSTWTFPPAWMNSEYK